MDCGGNDAAFPQAAIGAHAPIPSGPPGGDYGLRRRRRRFHSKPDCRASSEAWSNRVLPGNGFGGPSPPYSPFVRRPERIARDGR